MSDRLCFLVLGFADKEFYPLCQDLLQKRNGFPLPAYCPLHFLTTNNREQYPNESTIDEVSKQTQTQGGWRQHQIGTMVEKLVKMHET